MRAFWPAPGLGARVITYRDLPTDGLPESGVVVWQKSIDLDAVRHTPHLKHVWDVCDPMWWWNPANCREIADAVDAVVCSSGPLHADFERWYKLNDEPPANERLTVVTIPDRIDLSHFRLRRKHEPRTPVKLIWFGVAVNRIALFAVLANLERLTANGLRFELTICDDRPEEQWHLTDAFPIYYVRWRVNNENQILANHDIALLPPYPGPWGRVKSNNKALTAWACGLPVLTLDNYDLLRDFVASHHTRRAEAAAGWRLLSDSYTIDQTVRDWKTLIASMEW